MKKLIAVVLAAIMACSLGVSGFAAELRTEVLDGQMVIVAQNEHIAAGGTYTIPVSIVSDVTLEGVTSGTLYAGFTVAVGGAAGQFVDILSIDYTAAALALPGFTSYECQYNDLGDNTAYVAFSAGDLSLLSQTNFEVATVTIKVADEYPAGGEMAQLDLGTYNLSWTADFGAAPAFADEDYVAVVDGNDDIVASLTCGGVDDQFIVNPGFLADSFTWDPAPALGWKDRLIRWAEEQALKIVNFFGVISDVLAGLLEGELAK